jgi:hypothetical protein
MLAERRSCAPASVRGLTQVPASLRDPRAHRARKCLLYLAEHPGASNRRIATAIGITRHDQISTLLSRLARGGLVVNQGRRPGLANAWSLSIDGQRVARALLTHNDVPRDDGPGVRNFSSDGSLDGNTG